MKFNWWRIGAASCLATSLVGLIAGILLDSGWVLWALAILLSFNTVRHEWLVQKLAESKEHYDETEETI